MVEQRYKAVLEVLESGVKMTDVAKRFGFDRKTIYRWLIRYANEGIGSLENRGKPSIALTRFQLRSRCESSS